MPKKIWTDDARGISSHVGVVQDNAHDIGDPLHRIRNLYVVNLIASSETVSGDLSVIGNVKIPTLGKGLQIKEGANGRLGQATLINGQVVVANTTVTAQTRIFLNYLTVNSGNPGVLSPGPKVAGTSFTINSTNSSDNNLVEFLLIEAL